MPSVEIEWIHRKFPRLNCGRKEVFTGGEDVCPVSWACSVLSGLPDEGEYVAGYNVEIYQPIRYWGEYRIPVAEHVEIGVYFSGFTSKQLETIRSLTRTPSSI